MNIFKMLSFIIMAIFLFGCVPNNNKSIKIIVPAAIGNSTDIVARFIAEKLEKDFNITALVENKPGAGNIIGIMEVKKSNPDGNTILFVSSTITTLPATNKNLPFDVKKDFIPIGIIVNSPFVIVTPPNKYKNFNEFLEDAKNRNMIYGGLGYGTATQFATISSFLKKYDIKNHRQIIFKGNNQAMIEVMANRLDYYIVPKSTISTDNQAYTIFEDIKFNIWFGIFVKTGASNRIVNDLSDKVKKILESDDFKEWIVKNNFELTKYMNPEEFKNFVYSEIDKYESLNKELSEQLE